MIRLLHAESKTIVSAATIVAVFAFGSRFAGFIRDRILAGTFGAGSTLDAYYAAFIVPDLLFNLLVVGALSASFIPLFTKHYRAILGSQRAWRLTNIVLNILALGLFLVSLVAFIFAPQLARLIAPTFSDVKLDLVTDFTRVMLVSDWLLAVSAVFGSALQGAKRFVIYSLSPVLYNLGIIFGAVFLVDAMGPIGLAWGVVLGALAHALLQYLGLRSAGYRYERLWAPFDSEVKEIIRLAIPRTMGLAVSQLNNAILLMIAAAMTVGSVTVLQFASNIQYFAIGIVAVSFAIAAFPTLSETAAKGDRQAFAMAFSQTARQILFFIIPATVVFLLLRAQIVRVVVGAGAFGWQETIVTADALAFFALSFFAQGLSLLLARAFYAHRDTVTPFVAGLVSTFFTVIAALLFAQEFGVAGLALAFSLSAIVNASILWMTLRIKVGSLGEQEILHSLFRISLSALFAGVTIQLMKPIVAALVSNQTFFGVLLQGLIAGGAGLVVYGCLAWLMKTPEMLDFVAAMQRKMLKRFEPTENVRLDH